MDDVEELFVRHFTEGDKRKTMKYLKPNQKEESHATTFFIGKDILTRFVFLPQSA
jgi:xenotropic and polytropic retrovirus receptor 1